MTFRPTRPWLHPGGMRTSPCPRDTIRATPMRGRWCRSRPGSAHPLDVEADMTAGSGPLFVVNRGAVVTGVALLSGGGLLLTTGAAVTTVALLRATRRWVAQLDTPPSEVAKRQLAHAKAATS